MIIYHKHSKYNLRSFYSNFISLNHHSACQLDAKKQNDDQSIQISNHSKRVFFFQQYKCKKIWYVTDSECSLVKLLWLHECHSDHPDAHNKLDMNILYSIFSWPCPKKTKPLCNLILDFISNLHNRNTSTQRELYLNALPNFDVHLKSQKASQVVVLLTSITWISRIYFYVSILIASLQAKNWENYSQVNNVWRTRSIILHNYPILLNCTCSVCPINDSVMN